MIAVLKEGALVAGGRAREVLLRSKMNGVFYSILKDSWFEVIKKCLFVFNEQKKQFEKRWQSYHCRCTHFEISPPFPTRDHLF